MSPLRKALAKAEAEQKAAERALSDAKRREKALESKVARLGETAGGLNKAEAEIAAAGSCRSKP